MFAAVVVLIAGVVGWLMLCSSEPHTVTGEPANVLATPTAATSPSVGRVSNDAGATDATVRTAVATDSPAPPPHRGWRIGKPAEPLPTLPAGLPVAVVDLRGEAVAGASVSVFERSAKGGRDPGPPRQQRIADAAGRARITIAGPCIVSAECVGCGWSGDMYLWPARSRLPDELRLVLLPMATVRGRVLLADGSPAAGATTHAQSGAAADEPSGTLTPFAADADGRFRVQVRTGAGYSFTAQIGSQQSEPQWLDALAAGEVRDVTLVFAGGYSVRGLVLDAARQPVRALIQVVPVDAIASRIQPAIDSAPDGRFEVPLAHAGRYQVMAMVAGQSPAVAEVILDVARPRAQVTLSLQPLAVVTGKVVDERAAPCAGMKVHLQAVTQPTSDTLLLGLAMGLQGHGREAVTDATGSFRFDADAGGRYRVGARPVADNPWLFVYSGEFPAPVTGLTIVASAADQQGFELSGTVVAADGSALTTEVSIGLCVPGERKAAVGTGSDGRFHVGPFRVARRLTFEVEAIGFAPAILGPFDTTTAREHVTVRLQRWATVRCRVLRADGTPAPHAIARLERSPPSAWPARAWQGETDAAGCITFHNVVPATYRVLAKPTRHAIEAPAVDALALPGETRIVQVVLGK